MCAAPGLLPVQMLWTFARFGYQDETLMDMMHDIALKLQANCNSTSLAEVVYAMAQLGWADSRLHSLVADYAMDNIQVGTAVWREPWVLAAELMAPPLFTLLQCQPRMCMHYVC
jgi:hypothetical protein